MTPRLLAGIGGTHARFAWQAGPGTPVTDAMTLACAEHAGLEQALLAYLQRLDRPAPRQGAIAIATPVSGDRVQMTNHHWSFSISVTQARFRFDKLRVLNDFTALALALPALAADERRPLGGGASQSGGAPRCVEALNLFCAFLGIVAGNLALTLGARGGTSISAAASCRGWGGSSMPRPFAPASGTRGASRRTSQGFRCSSFAQGSRLRYSAPHGPSMRRSDGV